MQQTQWRMRPQLCMHRLVGKPCMPVTKLMKSRIAAATHGPAAAFTSHVAERLLATPLPELMAEAAAIRDQAHRHITFSPKVFIPLTRLCRDSCNYCTFAQPPKPGRRTYMTIDEVLEVCKLGQQQGCMEALFTLGDKPELLYPEAASELASMGYSSTLEYVQAAAAAVIAETGLLPHINAGVMSQQNMERLKHVSASQGLMLEGTSPALLAPGGAHHNCPDKDPALRLAVIEAAGKARVPFTSGILIGIGEARDERLQALQSLSELHHYYGHIQEVIIQNFRAKPNTLMQHHLEPPLEELLWTVAAARIIFGPAMNIQAPPNLTPATADNNASTAASNNHKDSNSSSSNGSGKCDGSSANTISPAFVEAGWRALIDAGINDWGGISPITKDYVNPEKSWPHLAPLAAATAAAGKLLLPRLPVYPEYTLDLSHISSSSRQRSSNSRGSSLVGTSSTLAQGSTSNSSQYSSSSDRGSSSSVRSQQAPWLSRKGGARSVAAAVLHAADSSGLLRGSSWMAGKPDQAAVAPSHVRHADDLQQWPHADQVALIEQLQEPVLLVQQAQQQQQQPLNGQRQQQSHQQQAQQQADLQQTTVAEQQIKQRQRLQLTSSIPLPRPRQSKEWKIVMSPLGVLEGLPAPQQVCADIQQLLTDVLQTANATAPPPSHSSSSTTAAMVSGVSGTDSTISSGDSRTGKAVGRQWAHHEVELLLSARGADMQAVVAAADSLRVAVCGDNVSYVVNRNINYTNVCTYGCTFCAFSKGKPSEALRGASYLLPLHEVTRRTTEAWKRGATEVCMQGGIHPDFTGQMYLDILAAAKAGAPDIHVHAFSPLEVLHGATSLGCSVPDFLAQLKAAGLGSLPGTAAEVLDPAVRAVLCPDKLSTEEWLGVVETAHTVGLRTTSTIMFGHVDSPAAWARHLLLLRDLQARTGGITEFVPLPFVHMEAPIFLADAARRGPTLRECVLMHAVARLVLHPLITNIQASWVKMGPTKAAQLLAAGCNDMGGSIMNESITRAAGASYGQELTPWRMEELIIAAGLKPYQRTTLYGRAPKQQQTASLQAEKLLPLQTGPARQRR